MMDMITTKVPTKVLPKEYADAQARVIRRDTRAIRMNGTGATTGGMAVTSKFISKLIPSVEAKLVGKTAADSADFGLEFTLRKLRPDVIALAALQGALHSIGRGDNLRGTYTLIGRIIERECFVNGLLAHDKKRGEELIEKVTKKHGSTAARMGALRKAAGKPQVRKKRSGTEYRAGFMVDKWDVEYLIVAGAWCVSRLREALPDVFELASVPDRTDGQQMLILTDTGMGIAESAVHAAIFTRPVYAPRTTKPDEWTRYSMKPSEDERVVNEVTLLRTRHKDIKSAAAHAIRTGAAAPALKGVNTLQNVAWKVNEWIMGVIEECWSQGIPVPGLPMRSAVQRVKLDTEQFAALSVEERELHSIKADTTQKLNLARIGETLSYHEDMQTAHRMAKAGSFYTPMNLDWRGRVYGISFFNFQREDRVRSLFMFANGAPITERGIYWLKVHVANCAAFKIDGIGIDKLPLDARVAWVDEHMDIIREAVEWPTGRVNQWWRDADAPFLFLASARELVCALDAGPQYVTHLPVAFDGSCSGIQHLACMTRAEEGRFVNLTDIDQPEDIYQRVADLAKASIERDLEVDEELSGEDLKKADRNRRYAQMALKHKITRKIAKRNTMTFAYSSKVFGMGQQQMVDTMEPLKVEVLKGLRKEHPFGNDSSQFGAAKYLARHIYAAITSLVKRPAEAMGCLQSLAGALAHECKPVRWTTPVGLPWINRYHEPMIEKIRLTLTDNGVRTQQGIWAVTGDHPEIAKDRSRNAVAPNFVHALDSSHLLLTVGAAADEGITDIATVHDSFGCLPCHADRFNEIIREQLVMMYEQHDVLAEIYESAKADLTVANHYKLPPALPEYGTLNLKEILMARYAFA